MIGNGIHAFLAHFKQLKQKDDATGLDGFDLEFQEFKDAQKENKELDTFPADAGKLPVNRSKNRYRDILPYDITRVKLPEADGLEGSDYINANYIRGRDGAVRYIAAQGPIDNTVSDFWRMIVAHDIRVIIMAAKVFEEGKRKCAEYWPEATKQMAYGNVIVYNEGDVDVSADYTCHKLRVTTADGETRSVYHYHYTAWPDHGIPTSPESLLYMISGAHKAKGTHASPIVVHCSAGCGRTGTIITIDIIWDILKQHGLESAEINLKAIIAELRTQRQAMVQTKEQLLFCYQAASTLIKHFQQGIFVDGPAPRSMSVSQGSLASSRAAPSSPTQSPIYATVSRGPSNGSSAEAAAATAAAKLPPMRQTSGTMSSSVSIFATAPSVASKAVPISNSSSGSGSSSSSSSSSSNKASSPAPASSPSSSGFNSLKKIGRFLKKNSSSDLPESPSSASPSSTSGARSSFTGASKPASSAGSGSTTTAGDTFLEEESYEDDMLAHDTAVSGSRKLCSSDTLVFGNRVRKPAGPRMAPFVV